MATLSLTELGTVVLLLSFCQFGLTAAFELNFDTTAGILVIVGIAVAGLAILIIVIACCCYCSKSDKKRPVPAPAINVVNSASSDKSHVIASTQFAPQTPYNPGNNVTHLSTTSAQRASSPPAQQSNVPNRQPSPGPQVQPLVMPHPSSIVVQQQHSPSPTPVSPQPQSQQLPTSPVSQQQINRLSYTQQPSPGPAGMSSFPQSPRTPTVDPSAQPVQRPPSFITPHPILERNPDRASARLPKSIYKNPFGFPEDNFEDLLIVELKTRLPPKQPYLGQNYSVNSEPAHQHESWHHDDRMKSMSPGPAGSYSPSLPRVQAQGHQNQVQSDYASDNY